MSYLGSILTTTRLRIKTAPLARYLGAMKPLFLFVFLGLGLAQDSDTDEVAEPPIEMGSLLLDVRQPVQIDLDGQTIGQLYRPGEIHMAVQAGDHVLRVHLNGVASEHPLTVDDKQATHVLISEGGVFTPERNDDQPEVQAFTELTFAAHADQAFMVQLGRDRFVIDPQTPVQLKRATGSHPLSVRNEDGTVIWVNGTLHLAGTSDVTLHLIEGKSPQISGDATLRGAAAP